MVCPRCGSGAVTAQAVTTQKTTYRSCCSWFLWILLAICTCGLILIIPAVRNSRTRTKTRVIAICQNCGKSWYL